MFSPVPWLLVFVAARPFLVAAGVVSATLAAKIRNGWYGVSVLATLWSPVMRKLAAALAGSSGARPVAAAARRLMRKIRAGGDVTSEVESIREFAEEGNVDGEHLDAALWLWLGARYSRRPQLEQLAATRVMALLLIDRTRTESRWLRPQYIAWRLRAEAELERDPALRGLLPPDLA